MEVLVDHRLNQLRLVQILRMDRVVEVAPKQQQITTFTLVENVRLEDHSVVQLLDVELHNGKSHPEHQVQVSQNI